MSLWYSEENLGYYSSLSTSFKRKTPVVHYSACELVELEPSGVLLYLGPIFPLDHPDEEQAIYTMS